MYELLRWYFRRYRLGLYKRDVRDGIKRGKIVWKYAKAFSQDLTLASRKGNGRAWVSLIRQGKYTMRALVDLDSAQALLEERGYPLVSYLMPTCDRFSLAQRAVECFRKQTYPNKELVIVDDSVDEDLGRWIGSLHDSRIRHVGVRGEEKKLLGVLRNVTLQHARGEYIALWDDDDLSHPDRVTLQMQLMFTLGADGAFLNSETLWWPARKWLVEMERNPCNLRPFEIPCHFWENTMVLRKDKIEEWPNIEKSVDGTLCARILPKMDVVSCSTPGLYLRLLHGKNLWDEDHFRSLLHLSGKTRYRGRKYNRALGRLSKELGIELDDTEPSGYS